MRWTEMVICDVEFALVFSWVIREDYNDIHTVLSHAIISNSFILKDLLREERKKCVHWTSHYEGSGVARRVKNPCVSSGDQQVGEITARPV